MRQFPDKHVKGSFPSDGHKCSICGKTKGLVKSKCCGQWICGDIQKSKRKSCYIGHERYTLCGYHYRERHSGKWQDCKKCKDEFSSPDYIWYVINKHNTEELDNPPEMPEIRCLDCDCILDYEINAVGTGDGYKCFECSFK